ncbi:MAG: hypothetical protein ACK456_01965 [Pseudanabaenaceae cyanobacterium]
MRHPAPPTLLLRHFPLFRSLALDSPAFTKLGSVIFHITAQIRHQIRFICLTGLAALLLFCSGMMTPLAPVFAKPTYHPVIPANGAPQLGGNLTGYEWQKANTDSRIAYCESALAAFRGSAAQSYIISHNVQSLSPSGLCRRMDQFYSLEENLETRLGQAAALAPLLFADIDIDQQLNPENAETAP